MLVNNLNLEEGVVALSYVAIDNSNRISNPQGSFDKKACFILPQSALSELP